MKAGQQRDKNMHINQWERVLHRLTAENVYRLKTQQRKTEQQLQRDRWVNDYCGETGPSGGRNSLKSHFPNTQS